MARYQPHSKWKFSQNHPFAHGGQASLYNVTNLDGNEQSFVMKVYDKRINDERLNLRYQAEIETLRLLKGHPNIIKIIDVGELVEKETRKTHKYIVMEKADKDLGHIISSATGFLSIEKISKLFIQILEGVTHIHHQHPYPIVHRDLKPQNILMVGSTPKIADFGICLNTDVGRVTTTGERVGPYYYMAPEMENGMCLDVDVRADFYSLGKMLYFILSKGRVFARENYDSKENDIGNIRKNKGFSQFNSIFRKTIVARECRYNDIEEFINDFLFCVSHIQLVVPLKFEKIKRSHQEIAEKTPSSFISWLILGESARIEKNYNEAHHYYENAKKYHATYYYTHLYSGMNFLEWGGHEQEAETCFLKALQIDPQRYEAWEALIDFYGEENFQDVIYSEVFEKLEKLVADLIYNLDVIGLNELKMKVVNKLLDLYYISRESKKQQDMADDYYSNLTP